MAAHTNRSPLPLSSRPTTNPNPRNSEIHSSTRRSFNGNSSLKPSSLTNPRRFDPITPANSPSVVSGRSSVGKDCTGSYLKDCEGKENSERDQIKSPAKGSKNFMTPTISAASKITSSPKKRPFVERNDLVRTSISLSDGKAMFFSNASEDLDSKSDMNKKVPTSYLNSADSPVPKPSKKVTFLDVPQEALSDSVVTDSDCPKMESFSKNKSSFCSPLLTRIAPLDADPSMPPYDPKTNFLSPRPQFLYYKPNPRIEILLNKEKGTEDDNFMSENLFENSSSDSEGTEVSMDSEEILETIASSELVDLDFSEFVGGDNRDAEEDPEKEKLEAIASADTYEGLELEFSEFVGGDNCAAEEDPEKEKLEAIASADIDEGLELEDDHFFLNEKSSSVEKDKKKTRGSSRFVCFSVVTMMLLTFACVPLSVMRSPSFEEFGVIKESTFSDLGRLYHQSRAEVIFDRVIKRVDWLFFYSTAVISKMVDELGKGEKTQLSLVKYMNLSGLEMDSWNGGHFSNINDEVGKNSVENAEDYDDELYEELDAEIADFEEELEAYEEVNESIENIEEEHETQEDDVSQIKEKIPCDSSISDSEYSEDTQSQEEIIIPADQLTSIISPVIESEVEAKPEHVPPEIMEIEKSSGHIINHGPDTDQESLPDVNSLTESVQSSLTPERGFIIANNYHTIGIVSSLFVALFAFTAYFYGYRGNPSLSSDNVIGSTKPEKKAFSSDDDVMDVSPCPSEMSSFQKNVSSYNNRNKEIRGLLSDVQSVDRNTRKQQPSKRESLASSSSEFTTGSPSYGSFTTFEKIPLKNATGEEEIITPVRRSSRIRNHNQFTSP